VVVDYARQRLAQKRGGDLHRVTDLPEDIEGGIRLDEDMLGLDTALTRLTAVDPRLTQVVELRYFAGLSELEIAALLKRSERSVRRDWQKARMFLLASLRDTLRAGRQRCAMDAERWQRLSPLLDALLELAPEQRANTWPHCAAKTPCWPMNWRACSPWKRTTRTS
jgi:hypothetical protein